LGRLSQRGPAPIRGMPITRDFRPMGQPSPRPKARLQFITVQTAGNRISKYIEVLPDGTSLAAAKTAVLTNLPSDAVAQSLNVSHTASTQGQTSSCAFWNLSSAKLGKATGSSGVSVEMAYDDSSGAPSWRPNNVNTLTFDIGVGLSTDVC